MTITTKYGLEKMDYGTTGQNVIHDNNMDLIDTALPYLAQTVEEGESSGAGEITFSMPFRMVNYKVVLIYLDAFDNTETYTFPTAFNHIPMGVSEEFDSAELETCISSLTTTDVTITANGESGFIQLIGF